MNIVKITTVFDDGNSGCQSANPITTSSLRQSLEKQKLKDREYDPSPRRSRTRVSQKKIS